MGTNTEKNKRGKHAKAADSIEQPKQKAKAGLIIAGLFLLLYVPSLINWLNSDSVVTDIIRTGYIEESVNSEGLIIRDEELLEAAPIDGSFIPQIAEGERVAAFNTVAAISNSASTALLNELDEINRKIAVYQNEKMSQLNLSTDEYAKVNEQISREVASVTEAVNKRTLYLLKDIQYKIDQLIAEKAIIAGESSSDPYIVALKKERNSIQNRISSNTGNVTSPGSGIVSYIIDGYEQQLNPNMISSITAASIKATTGKKNEGKVLGSSIKKGEHFVKIIKSFETHLAFLLQEEEADDFEEGDKITVRINDILEEIPGRVAIKGEHGEEGTIVVIRIDRCAEDLTKTRTVNADIVSYSKEGLKVPVKSLYDINSSDHTAKIMMIKANVTAERAVVILGSNSEYAVIKSPDGEVKKTVSLYDTYVINPEGVREGQIVD